MKIEKLTPHQEKYLPEFRARYLKAGLSTKHADTEKIRPLIQEMYSYIDKRDIPVIVVSSPLSANILIHMLKKNPKSSLGSQLGSQLWDQLGRQLVDQLVDQLWDQLGSQLWDQLGRQLSDQLRNQLVDQLSDQLRNQLRDQLRESKIDYIHTNLWGSMDLNWIALYQFAQEIGVNYSKNNQKKLRLMQDIGFNCGWIYPFDNLCIVCDRPEIINMTAEGVLHCENGPSVKFRDGLEIYTWRGIKVPKEWITNPESLTAQIALHHENIEQRRAACEILGWHNILSELNAMTIDKDPDPQIGELLEVDIPDIGREKFLKVECGTSRTFAIPVPPEMKTAIQANSWTYGLTPEEYKPEIRT